MESFDKVCSIYMNRLQKCSYILQIQHFPTPTYSQMFNNIIVVNMNHF